MARSSDSFVSITIDERSLAEADRILRAIPNGAQRAMSTALNKTVKSGRTLLSRLVAKRLKVKVGDVKSRIYARTANIRYLRATLDVDTHRILLISLGAAQTSRGVTYRPFGGITSRLLPHAFIAKGPSRGTQVWLRSRYVLGRVKQIEWRGRTMEALYLQKGGSLSDVIEPQDIQRVVEKASHDLPKNIDSQVAWVISKWGSRGRR